MRSLSNATFKEINTNAAKSVIVRDAQIEWKKTYMKNPALLSDYLKPREGEKPFLSGNCGDVDKDDRILIDFAFEYMQQDTQSDDDKSLSVSSFSLVPNSSDVLRSQFGMNKSTSVTGHDIQILTSFVEILCPGKSNEILSDDVLNNDSFLKIMCNSSC